MNNYATEKPPAFSEFRTMAQKNLQIKISKPEIEMKKKAIVKVLKNVDCQLHESAAVAFLDVTFDLDNNI